MSAKSDIEWTDATWNPVRGCRKISPGCKHCYAETFANRFVGVPGHPYEQGFTPRTVDGQLVLPFTWRKGRRVFVNSMSDLFQDDVPEAFIRKTFEVMAATSWHTYQVLTKRAERMMNIVHSLPAHLQLLPNVWLGVSVEDRRHGLPRVQNLQDTPAMVHFLSIEPLLEELGTLDLRRIQWVVVGGESGPGARPMMQEWVEPIRDQCLEQGVPFFFKQWGGVHKSKTGRSLDGRLWLEFPPSAVYMGPGHAERLSAATQLGLSWPLTTPNAPNRLPLASPTACGPGTLPAASGPQGAP